MGHRRTPPNQRSRDRWHAVTAMAGIALTIVVVSAANAFWKGHRTPAPPAKMQPLAVEVRQLERTHRD